MKSGFPNWKNWCFKNSMEANLSEMQRPTPSNEALWDFCWSAGMPVDSIALCIGTVVMTHTACHNIACGLSVPYSFVDLYFICVYNYILIYDEWWINSRRDQIDILNIFFTIALSFLPQLRENLSKSHWRCVSLSEANVKCYLF